MQTIYMQLALQQVQIIVILLEIGFLVLLMVFCWMLAIKIILLIILLMRGIVGWLWIMLMWGCTLAAAIIHLLIILFMVLLMGFMSWIFQVIIILPIILCIIIQIMALL